MNLATEQVLTEEVQKGEIILYLWQNERTVVIGRNQNAWKECRVGQLEEDHGHLARRLSGGGAVFHDIGNLNFSFCVRREDYDVERQLEVILQAVQRFGIEVKKTGRNDLEVPGQGKFSGNAFLKTEKGCCHHGTIMLQVDREELGRYLSVSAEKLASKGVDSVRSRVVNLKDLCPEITVDALCEALKEAFGQVYGLPVEEVPTPTQIQDQAEYLSSWDWRFGRRIPFTVTLEHRFSWGGVELDLRIDEGIIREIVCYTDAMDPQLSEKVERALTLCRFRAADMAKALEFEPELAAWIRQNREVYA